MEEGEEVYLPLYEGKMVQAFDHRAASVVVNPENLNRPAQPREATLEEHTNPNWLPDSQFWVNGDSLGWPDVLDWTVAIKHVSASTNVRTIIVALVPRAGFGNSLPVFFQDKSAGIESTPTLAACPRNTGVEWSGGIIGVVQQRGADDEQELPSL